MDRFGWQIGWRLGAVVAGTALGTYLYVQGASGWWLVLLGALIARLIINLYTFLTGINRKLTRFLESVQYSDFAVSFRADSQLGSSFRNLNDQFNLVLSAFRQAREEKEAGLHYLNTLIQHVSVGLLTYDSQFQIELINQSALRLLGIYRLRLLTDLDGPHPELRALIAASVAQHRSMLYVTPAGQELSVSSASLRLGGRSLQIVSLQNIRSELQQREVEAWQNLTRVLRHEIMNSLTPMVSLAGTLREIVESDSLFEPTLRQETQADLKEAIRVIESRGQALIGFVEAYRSLSNVPRPQPHRFGVLGLLQRVAQLAQPYTSAYGLAVVCEPEPLEWVADAGQLEMVLLNLVKNAAESVTHQPQPHLSLSAKRVGERILLRVEDNGEGMDDEVLQQIFIPFFTTRSSGSGIGLSLSRQIIQQHGGQINVATKVGEGSTFSIFLPLINGLSEDA